MSQTIRIVEPLLHELNSRSGSFLRALLRAHGQFGGKLELWSGKGLEGALQEASGLHHQAFFIPSVRRLQAPFLYRKLLRQEGKVFLPSANRTELRMLDLAMGGRFPERRVFLYFHELELSDRKRESLARLARKQPETVMLAATEGVLAPLMDCGFRSCQLLPYPVLPPTEGIGPAPFRHLLCPGAARRNKGFAQVVKLVQHLRDQSRDLPITVQAFPPADGYEPGIAEQLASLKALKYKHLTCLEQPLEWSDYQQLYAGALVLQPYWQETYADRVSAVTIDALLHGAPIIAITDTWMERTVNRFRAGLSLDTFDPEQMISLIESMRRDFRPWQERARQGGHTLRGEHDPAQLLRFLVDY